MTQTHILRLIPVCAAVALLAACATTTPRPTAKADANHSVLKQRVMARWTDLIEHHAEKSWDYLTPGFKKTISREQYGNQMNNRPLTWTSANVNKVDCATPDRCTVYVIVNYTGKMSVGVGGGIRSFAPLKETWLQLGNQWYYLPREVGKSTLNATH